MIGRAVAGLAALGLVGGVGAVTYSDDGTATVKVTDKQGHTESVKIEAKGGKRFTCPDGTEAKLEPIDIRAGRVKITLRRVERDIHAIEQRYPGGEAPGDVVTRYNGLVKRQHGLVDAYNAASDDHNAVISADCEPE